MGHQGHLQDAWSGRYKSLPRDDHYIVSPGDQLLLRILKGKFIDGLSGNYEGQDVLEVGCGEGRNLVTCGLLGMNLHGCDIGDDIIEKAAHRLNQWEMTAEFRDAPMEALPYEDESFDMVIAWKVIHYSGSEENMRKALAEFRRVLRPGGVLLIETTAPKSYLYENADTNGNLWTITRDEFRKGLTLYCFNDEAELKAKLETEFDEVLVGRTTDQIFGWVEDHYLAFAAKR